MAKTHPRRKARQRRKVSIRKRIHGTAERPRLSVFRSTKHIYAQLVDDSAGHTLASASTLSPELREREGCGGNRTAAEAVGQLIAQKAGENSITQVVFDRNGYLYHGRIKALADAARKAGLDF